MKHYYSNYYIDWGWTEVAVNEYLNSFTMLDANQIDVKNQMYVGVYGPTQVGKTTFILSLLGIKEEYIISLSKALRGFQKKGKSATVTATYYEKIDSENFEINLPNNEIRIVKTLDDLEEELKKVRVMITVDGVRELKELVIKIPKIYFDKQIYNHNNLTIIDLPGDDTKNEDEEEHVNNVITYYLKLCRTIIIMELADKVNYLAQIDIEIIKEWYLYPHRFLIAFTRVYSNYEVKKTINNDEFISNQSIKKLFYEDVYSSINRDFDNSIYIFELGDTLIENKKKDNELYLKIKQWNEENFKDLVEKAEENNLPEFKLKNLKNIDIEIRKNKINNINTVLKKIELNEELLREKNRDLKKLIQIVEEKDKNFKMIKDKIENVINIVNDKSYLKKIDEYTEDINALKKIKYYDLNVSYKKLLGILNKESQDKISNIQQNKEIITKNIRKQIDEIPKITDIRNLNVKKNLLGKSNTYEYFFEIESLKDELQKAFTKLNKEFEKNKNNLMSKEYEEQIFLKKKIDDLKINIPTLKNDRDKQIILKSELETKWDEELKKIDLLDQLLIKEYNKQCTFLKKLLIERKVDSSFYPVFIQIMTVMLNQLERVIDKNE